MPILPAEPDIFPEQLLNEDFAQEPGPWWAVYTLSRKEKELMRRLRKLDIPHYSPLVKKKARSPSGRVRVSHVPLFPGYVFFRGDEAARYRVLTTNCVSQCLAVPDAAALVVDLRQIRRILQSELPVLAESRLEAGARVRIRSGPLMGLEGVVIKRHGQDRLLVAISFLQKGASVLIEDFVVEPID